MVLPLTFKPEAMFKIKPVTRASSTLEGHSEAILQVAFSPDGQTIASANEDKTVILWNKEQVLTLNPLMYGCNWVHDYLRANPNVSENDRHLCD